MRKILYSLFVFLLSANALQSEAQSLLSGNYNSSLSLAYDPSTGNVTGYFEDQTGWDEKYQAPLFSCVFYLEGKLIDNKCELSTYYPNDKKNSMIHGELMIDGSNNINIKLDNAHGGCVNVINLEEPVSLTLVKSTNWKQIKYVKAVSCDLNKKKKSGMKSKLTLTEGTIVCVIDIDGIWAYVSLLDNEKQFGWMKMADLN
jgi:hypothetical protein